MGYPAVPEKKNPGDKLVTKSADIAAPIETVFAVLEDVRLFVELEENVKEVTITSEVKSGKGMKSHWELYDPANGAQWFVDEEFIYYDKPNQIAYTGVNAQGMDYTGVHNLSRNSDGSTRLVFNEMFHFDVDDAIDEIVEGMVANVKKESERRSGGKV
jgi:uncharacterized protein YndB with AHSA1/START domain